MLQLRRVTILTFIILLTGSLAHSSETTDIPLGLDRDTKETSVVLAEKSATGMTLQLRTSHLEVSRKEMNGEEFQLINLPGAELEGADGRPALPLVTRLVAIPDGKTLQVNDITTLDNPMAGDFRPWPAQGLKNTTDQSFNLDQQYYLGVNPDHAPSMVTVGEPALLRGLRVVPVSFRPVVWTPSDGKLSVASEIDVTFDLVASTDGNNSSDDGRLIPRSFATIYESQVIGYVSKGNVMQGHGSYLIIHPDNATVLNNLQPLINWRLRQGYNVVVASTAVTGTNTTNIKNYIQNQYNSLSIPLEFITLVGDATGGVTIPTFIEGLSGYNGEGDHEYTLLHGGDVLSDVHIGRLSVTSTGMLADVVSKIVAYESDPWMDDDLGWFSRAGLSGDPSSSGYSCIWVNQWVKQQLLELNYTQIDTIWGGSFASQMFDTVDQGETIFTYRGYYGISGLSNSYIDAMNNKEKLPFALVLTCDTGSFRSQTTCTSESFFRNPDGGAVASMGTATLGTHTRYNNCMFQGVAEGVLNTGDPRVGPGLTMGKLHLYQNYFAREPDRVTIWSTWNNLMGDPATALWSAIPAALTVDYPGTLTADANNLPVTVTSGGLPQVDALVTIYGNGSGGGSMIQVSALTDGDGRVNLPLSGLVNGEYLVTITGRNLKPYLGGVNVGPMAASVNFAAVAVDDDNNGSSSGNGDMIVNPGETVELIVDLTNSGTGGVNNVTGDLASGNELVSVDQPTAAFGFMGSGATVSGQEAYVVRLDPGVPGGSVIQLELTASDGSQSWISLVDLAVSGPGAEVMAAFLGSGIINPGVSTTLEVQLKNIGDLATSGITASLTSTSSWISITDGNGTYGAISAGGNGTNSGDTFTISASLDCFPGHVATLNLDLVFAEGGTVSVPVLISVGSASNTDPTGPDLHGYYAFDNTDTDYLYAPVYDWVEISPQRSGNGTSVGLTDFNTYQDDVVIMPLPFPFTYYGQTFNEMSVCSNGWISMGGTDLRHYRNWTLPSLGTPDNMIAVYWDNLEIKSSMSGVFTWYDAANHRLIIEWDNMANSVTGVSETFQVILHDPAHGAGDTGDGIITMNFKDITPTDSQTGYATVGIQNEDRNDAVLYTYYNLYPRGCVPITDGSSLVFRTVIPQAQGILRGQVTNVLNDAPIDGATINVLDTGLNLLTAEDGKYQSSMVIGTYDLAVYHPSFAPDTTYNVVIQEGLETVVDFALTDILGPLFEMQALPESTPDTEGPYDVVFKVSDYSGIQETRFYYTSSTSGGPFELIPQAEGPADTWRVSIPGQPEETLVQYWLTSTDIQDLITNEPAGAPFSVHSFEIAQTTVLYSSEMENASDWTGGMGGDNATTGLWTNVDPNGVFEGQTEISPEDDHSNPGTMCWVTGQDPVGASQGTDDVDNGTTTLQSPVFDINGYPGVEVQYYRWYTNNTGNAPGEDSWVVQAQAQDGSWVNLENTTATNRSWQQMNFVLSDHLTLGNSLQFRFVASDLNAGSIVEAAVDDFVLTSFPLIADSEAPQVSLISPNGGEDLAPGMIVDITWNQSDDIGVVHVEILLSTDDGATFPHTIGNGALNNTFSWTVPDLVGNFNRVKIICHDSASNSTQAVSAEVFKIGNTSAVGDLPSSRLALAQNSPNPFNPRTEISFSVPSRQNVVLRIYNVEGRLVRTLLQGVQEAGSQTVVWSGKDDQGKQSASGLYFYRLVTDSGTLTRKMTLLK
ncbi:MAG: hypothetical protein DRP71_13065 [Verrucomicrobia bacterium]|nr:MAG: hypothetical protein DRP71_13065 [Verrucomicrobiota bacterium]